MMNQETNGEYFSILSYHVALGDPVTVNFAMIFVNLMQQELM